MAERLNMKRVLPALCLAALLAACGTPVTDLRNAPTSGDLRFPSSKDNIALRGILDWPGNAPPGSKVPAVVILHASGGVDARNASWSRWFRSQGYATLQVDYFGPRGIDSHSPTQPTPAFDAPEALKLLSTHPLIDARRIAVIGFSRGGTMALRASAHMPFNDEPGPHFGAYIALYPDCWNGYTGGRGAPLLLLVGSQDDLAPVAQCDAVIKHARSAGRDARLIVYEGAAHGWDGSFTGTWFHPAAGRSYSMAVDTRVTDRSRADVLKFLNEVMPGR